MSESLADIFREESGEILGDLEHALLELEEAPDDHEIVSRVFRSLHTLKGSGAMAGFNDIAAFAHEIETFFEEVRSGAIPVTRGLINLTLAARDQINLMVEAYCGTATVDEAESTRILTGYRALLQPGPNAGTGTEPPSRSAAALPAGAPATSDLVTYRIRFRLNEGIFHRGVNPLYLLRELGQLGDCLVVAHTEHIPDFEQLDPESCYLAWDVILTSGRGRDAIEDVFIFVSDDCQLTIDVIDAAWLTEDGDRKLIGEILVERGDLRPADLLAALAERRRLGDVLVAKHLVTPAQVSAALTEQNRVQQLREHRRSSEVAESVRVKSEKLDSLVNLIGELVTVQARLSQIAQEQQGADLLNVSEVVERLTWELRDQVLTIRMLPIGATFTKLRRLVYDLAQELGKDVQLVTEGAETELDKTVIERLNDPLVHLIRNCIDHGIEAPEERRQRGKPATGSIRLSAAHVGAHVVLTIRDDGAGIDRTALRRRAEQQGLVAPGTELSDRELLQCILAPGFSTARSVTELSGRGVGMDVVRQAVEALRGDLEIASSAGEGTCFTIRLPLTLAIIDGLLVRVGAEDYVLPLAAVEECIELGRAQVERFAGRNLVNVRDRIVPYVRLREQFSVAGAAPALEQVVIADVEGERVGFVVDYVVGEHQTVIKNLGRFYKGVQGLSGATILGDGRVALILDLPALRQVAGAQEKQQLEVLA